MTAEYNNKIFFYGGMIRIRVFYQHRSNIWVEFHLLMTLPNLEVVRLKVRSWTHDGQSGLFYASGRPVKITAQRVFTPLPVSQSCDNHGSRKSHRTSNLAICHSHGCRMLYLASILDRPLLVGWGYVSFQHAHEATCFFWGADKETCSFRSGEATCPFGVQCGFFSKT